MRGAERALIGLALLAALGTGTPAQSAPLDHLPALVGDYFAIDSREASHRYHVYIRLPDGYAGQPAKQYPVVYLLDGDSLFPYLAPHHLFLNYDDGLPEAIIVGIAYGSFSPPANRRELDFGNGAEAFQRFLKNELIPEIEKRTRADPMRRILVGQSRGGGFVLYSAYTDPDVFWGRIASCCLRASRRPPGVPTSTSQLSAARATGQRSAPVRWNGSRRGRERPDPGRSTAAIFRMGPMLPTCPMPIAGR